MKLTTHTQTDLVNCQYNATAAHLKCHTRGCHKQIDTRTNETHCYWHWRVEVRATQPLQEWQEVAQ